MIVVYFCLVWFMDQGQSSSTSPTALVLYSEYQLSLRFTLARYTESLSFFWTTLDFSGTSAHCVLGTANTKFLPRYPRILTSKLLSRNLS